MLASSMCKNDIYKVRKSPSPAHPHTQVLMLILTLDFSCPGAPDRKISSSKSSEGTNLCRSATLLSHCAWPCSLRVSVGARKSVRPWLPRSKGALQWGESPVQQRPLCLPTKAGSPKDRRGMTFLFFVCLQGSTRASVALRKRRDTSYKYVLVQYGIMV